MSTDSSKSTIFDQESVDSLNRVFQEHFQEHYKENEMHTPQLVVGGRQTGKTTLLIQHMRDVKEGHSPIDPETEVVVVAKSGSQVDLLKQRMGRDLSNNVTFVSGHQYFQDLEKAASNYKNASNKAFYFFDVVPGDVILNPPVTMRKYPFRTFIEAAFDHPRTHLRFLT